MSPWVEIGMFLLGLGGGLWIGFHRGMRVVWEACAVAGVDIQAIRNQLSAYVRNRSEQ